MNEDFLRDIEKQCRLALRGRPRPRETRPLATVQLRLVAEIRRLRKLLAQAVGTIASSNVDIAQRLSDEADL